MEDRDAVNVVKQYLPPNPVIIEAGVCDAEDTIRFKGIWPDATIYGFEPVPDLYEKSVRNTMALKDVKLFPFALAEVTGEKMFCESTSMPGASSFFKDNLKGITVPDDIAEEFKRSGETYNDIDLLVECMTIDDFCYSRKIKSVDFIWLDTEGYELRILAGGAKKILPTVTALMLELNFQEFRKDMPLFDEVYDFAIRCGFELKCIWQARPNWQANGIFVRKV